MTDLHGRRDGDPTSGQPGEGTPQERLLRAMLHRAVAEVEPDSAALPRIRVGVPRRRVRYRNTWTGAAAAVLMAAAAVPAIQGIGPLGLSGGPGGDAAHTPIHPGGSPTGPNRDALHSAVAGRPADSATGASLPADPGTAAPSPTAGSGSASPSAPAQTPWCAPADLGQSASRLETADAAGKVYGWFALRNTSGASCRVPDGGVLRVTTAVGSEPGSVKVLPHRAGDAAAALPAPPAQPQEVLLAPGAWYRVRFGWVPGSGCTTPGAGPSSQAVPAVRAGLVEPATAVPNAAEPGDGSSPSPSAPASPTPSPSPSPSGPEPVLTLAYAPQAAAPQVAELALRGSCGGTVHQSLPEPFGTADQPSAPAGG
ncbi:hypothetical protein AB0K43_24845 [Kitasatospora sp. NPDC049258]|uniref:hypothetical protein n=1 Tax=Kitasatospora sp. NPDC049258 TaxID=3155394 RepID=UPI00344202B2